MPSDVRQIANAVLDAADRAGFPLTNMSLNKIVYFAHAWHLARYSEPLIDSLFEAWQYGPVHPQLYRQLKHFGEAPISTRLTRIDLHTGADVPVEVHLSETQIETIEQITLFYGRFPAWKLVEFSHRSGAPWDCVWSAAKYGPVPGMIIPDELTESFYRKRLASKS
jgi:uncharacterized phage-associated protein